MAANVKRVPGTLTTKAGDLHHVELTVTTVDVRGEPMQEGKIWRIDLELNGVLDGRYLLEYFCPDYHLEEVRIMDGRVLMMWPLGRIRRVARPFGKTSAGTNRVPFATAGGATRDVRRTRTDSHAGAAIARRTRSSRASCLLRGGSAETRKSQTRGEINRHFTTKPNYS